MLNSLPINSGVINSNNDITIIPEIGEIITTSFNANLLTKYAFKSKLGSYFNFNNFCISGTRYGNYILDHNFDDTADTEILKYSNSLRHGGIIFDKRFQEKTLEMKINITSNSVANLEKEIRNLKSSLEAGGECYRKESDLILKINTEFIDMTVSRYRLTGTTVKIKMLTMDPFWTTQNATTVFNENNTAGSFNGSLNLSNTSIRGFVKHFIYLPNITGTINQLTLTINGYPIIVNEVLTSGGNVILDGINSKVFVNGNKVRFLGQFPELEIDIPHTLSVTFSGGGNVDKFDLYNIYLNQQL